MTFAVARPLGGLVLIVNKWIVDDVSVVYPRLSGFISQCENELYGLKVVVMKVIKRKISKFLF